MKRNFLRKSIIACIAASTLVSLAPIGASAAWVKNNYGNWSYTERYGYATGWRQIDGAWYFFDSFGLMQTGWIYDGGEWYYVDLSGAMQVGVIQIEGKIYLFSSSGAMQKGSNVINGKLYNFDNNGVCIGTDYPVPARAFDYYGSNTTPYVPSQIINENASMSKDIPSDGLNHVKQYTVTFKDPDAEDDEEEVLKKRIADEGTMMPLYKPSKNGYNFIEWNTKKNGDGTGYDDTDKIRLEKDITLYAQWEEINDNTDK